MSLFFLSDGDHVLPLSPAQDYKRLLDGDAGPNTGGMGAYSPLPWLDEPLRRRAGVRRPRHARGGRAGHPSAGCRGHAVHRTALRRASSSPTQGVKVIEFNARFGDPETQVVLPRLVDPLSRAAAGRGIRHLEDLPRPAFADAVAVTVVLASEGYPAGAGHRPRAHGLDAAAAVEGVHLAHAATAARATALVATGGRVLNVVGLGTTFAEARDRAYRALGEIGLEGGQYRTDIAARVVEH